MLCYAMLCQVANNLAGDAKYVGVSTQCVSAKDKNGAGGPNCVYVLRDDGSADRFYHFGSRNCTMVPPDGTRYVAASCQDTSAYLLRDDGAVDRTRGWGRINNTMNPPPGARYVGVSAGQWASYLVRSDGLIDRTTGGGTVGQTLAPADEVLEAEVVKEGGGEKEGDGEGRGCIVM